MTTNRGARWGAVIAAMLWPALMVESYWVALSHSQTEPSALQQSVYILAKVVQFAFPLVFVWWLGEGWDGDAFRSGAGVGQGVAFGGIVGQGKRI